MPQNIPHTIFGVHGLAAYNVNSRKYLGNARVIGSAELSSEAELVNLDGGSSKYSWKTEVGRIPTELSIALKEFPPFLFETLLGKTITQNAAEGTGNVTTIANALNTSMVAATGIASVAATAGSESDMRFGDYTVVAVSPTTMDVFCSTDVDFGRGTATSFQNDLLKITATPLTLVQSAAVAIPGHGISLTGGSGTIAMTVGDSATFKVRPINSESEEVVVGANTEVFNDFGLILTAQRPGDNYMTKLDMYKVRGAGLPIGMTEGAFAEPSVTLSLQYDVTRNGVYYLERVKATS